MLGYVFNWGRCYLHRELDWCPSHTSAVAHVRGLTYALSCHLLAERIVDLPRDPETVEQDSQLPSDSDHCPLLGILAARCSLKSPSTEVAVRTSVPENVVRSTNEHLAEIAVSRL